MKYKDNLFLQQELSRQARIVEKAEKYQKERDSIIEDNQNLHNEVEQIKAEHKQKENEVQKENHTLFNVEKQMRNSKKIFIRIIANRWK